LLLLLLLLLLPRLLGQHHLDLLLREASRPHRQP
jgi:hypothetical protein